MSRYHKKIDENKNLFYGYDHALGYWYEIWDNKNEEESPIEEGDQKLNPISKKEIMNVLEEHDVNLDHVNSILFNLPF